MTNFETVRALTIICFTVLSLICAALKALEGDD